MTPGPLTPPRTHPLAAPQFSGGRRNCSPAQKYLTMAILQTSSSPLSAGETARQGPPPQTPAGIGPRRAATFLLLLALIAAAFHGAIHATVALALRDQVYSFILLVPALCLFVGFLDRNRIFRRAGASTLVAGILAGVAAAVFGVAHLPGEQAGPAVSLMFSMLSMVVFIAAAFALCFGAPSLRAALFPLGLALFVAPWPRQYMIKPIEVIRQGSTGIAVLFFHLASVPVFREGYVLSLPRLSIRVAEECSGIHSSLALFIGSLLFGHMFLKAGWKKLLVVLAVFPIISLTNGFRIFAISMLSMYVNPAFMHGKLHRDGGFIFFTLALAILLVMIRLLRSIQPAKGPASS